jgi:hypothetical protein
MENFMVRTTWKEEDEKIIGRNNGKKRVGREIELWWI